ncbi:MAG: ABC transporter permease, partial [Methylococcales bacterium]|nr:ABC transporter permease [Methylococcales bacterium]
MINYIFRRFLYALPLLMGVNILTFVLFFIVNSPDDMARMQLGQKHVTQEAVDNWKQQRGYDLPLLWNSKAKNPVVETIFYQKSMRLFVFDFGTSDSGRNIGSDIQQRMWASLAIALPSLIVGLLVNISMALLMVLFRNSYIELSSIIICVILMSISSLFYIIGGQF